MLEGLLKVVTGTVGGLPAWATHVAVRDDGSKAEPAVWMEDEKEYLDEDPSQLKHGAWGGSYKKRYWTFISIEQLKAELAIATEAQLAKSNADNNK